MSWHVLIAWVVGVAGVDSWFTLVDSDVGEVELNPLALSLIRSGGVELLVSCKVAGTGLVVWIVASMRPLWPSSASSNGMSTSRSMLVHARFTSDVTLAGAG